MAIFLSLEESTNQIISGVPEYVTLTSSSAATIFFTLDGTTPTEESEIFIDKIVLPTTGKSITLKAIAIAGDESSSVLEESWFTKQKLNRTRLIEDEGINLLPPGEAVVESLSYDDAGESTQSSSIAFVDLELLGSTTNKIGESIPVDTTLSFVKFPRRFQFPEGEKLSNPGNNNTNFNPRADYIMIDGTTSENIENQIVRIINRPHNSMESHEKINNRLTENHLVTANFVRYMIDPGTGKMTFYYRDSRENRWISSTQKVDLKPLNLNVGAKSRNSFVFRWVEDRVQSKLY